MSVEVLVSRIQVCLIHKRKIYRYCDVQFSVLVSSMFRFLLFSFSTFCLRRVVSENLKIASRVSVGKKKNGLAEACDLNCEENS